MKTNVDMNVEKQKHVPIKYEDEFLHDWTLLCTRIENGLKLGEQLKLAIEERASLEELYSNGLERISSRFFPCATESTSMASAIRTLRNEIYRRSQHCKELSETLKSDVLKNTMNYMLENHKSAYNHLFTSGKKITMELQEKYLNFMKLRDNYGILRHNVGQLSLRYYQLNNESKLGNKIMLLSSEILRKILELNELEKEYNNSIESFNVYYKFYLKEMRNIINFLEDMDKKRIKCLSDVFMKMMIYDMSYIKNLQYDYDNVIRSLQEIDVEGDILEYANRFGSSCKNIGSPDKADNHNCNDLTDSHEFIPNKNSRSLKLNFDFAKKENWRDICSKMNNIEILDDEFIDLSATQMAEKNIILDNVLDLQTIISNLVIPVTAIKAQKAVKILLSQFNILMNEDSNNCIGISDKDETNSEQENKDLSTSAKYHSLESFSTACSTEIAPEQLSTEFDKKMSFTQHNNIDNNEDNNRIYFKKIYDQFIQLIVSNNLNKNDLLINQLKIIKHKSYGLTECENCNYYLDVLINEIMRSVDCKLIINDQKNFVDLFNEHLILILDYIQEEKNIWLFRKMLFISESLVIGKNEIFRNIYKHDVWSVVKIWEDTIVIGISEQHQKKLIESDEIELKKFKSIDRIQYYDKLNNIDNLASLMRKFGIPEIPIITLFTKICTQNGLEKSYCDQLINNIKNSG